MADKTYIRRSKHGKKNPYFMLLRATAQNKELSYEALGLLCYLLSKPDDWRVEIGDIQRQHCGRDKARSLLKELCDKGYAQRLEQTHEDGGRFGFGDYEISETPQFLKSPSTEKPSTVEPSTDNPLTETPSTVNPLQHNTELDRVENTVVPNGNGKAETPFMSMKNAIVAAFGQTELAERNMITGVEWGVIQKTAKELLKAGCTPDDVKGLYAYCDARYNNFSPRALSSNWTKYSQTRRPPTTVHAMPDTPPAAPDMTPTYVPAYDPEWRKQNGYD